MKIQVNDAKRNWSISPGCQFLFPAMLDLNIYLSLNIQTANFKIEITDGCLPLRESAGG